MLKEIKKETLSKTIIRALGEYIIVNNLKSGDRLPTEKELSEKFNVGRNVVREALKALEIIGLINSKPGLGTVLSSSGVEPFLLPFVFGIVLKDVGLGYLGEMRLAVEQGAARLAANNALPEEIEELQKFAEDIDELKEKKNKADNHVFQKELAKREVEFHKLLVEMSHNPIFVKFSTLWEVFFSRAQLTGDLTKASKAGDTHQVERVKHTEIVDAIRKKNENQAARAIRLHLIYWLERKQEIPTEMLVKLVSKT